MPWERIDESWVLCVPTEADDCAESALIEDDYVKVFLSVTGHEARYRIRPNLRWRFETIEDSKFITLFFGVHSKPRHRIGGQRLYRDKHIVIQRYGRKPRAYFIVARG